MRALQDIDKIIVENSKKIFVGLFNFWKKKCLTNRQTTRSASECEHNKISIR
jgi:hypothetical protein